MLMTREMDYAMRILHALFQEKQLSAADIAQRDNMPKAVTLKILKQLHAAGLVTSRRGPSGGYSLHSQTPLYLWDVFHALGESLFVNRCQQPEYHCENYPEGGCNLCRELTRVQSVLNEELRRTPLSAIFQKDQE